MLKKVYSIIIAFFIVMSILVTLPIETSAVDVEIARNGKEIEFMNTGVWNPYTNVYQDVDEDGYREIPCTYVAWQKAYEVCGVELPSWSHANTWYSSAQAAGIPTGTEPRINSIACFNSGYYGHVSFVTAVNNDNTMNVIEGGRYDLDRTASQGVGTSRPSSIVGVGGLQGFIYLSNPGPSFTPADIGTGFYASIDNTKSAKPIIASGNNVVLGEMSGEQNQIWRFDKQNDTSYKITNVATGTCLDDANYGTANETNIQVCASNDTTAQRWYLKVVGSGYSLVPKCALNSCIDVQGGVLTSGQNIQLFQQNGSDAQIFSISPRPSFNAVNKGDTFTAAIIFNATGSAVTAFENNNVGAKSYTGNASQLWNFERMGNRSYKITNVATGKCLDDENYGTADKTNIQVCTSNNSTAQRWFLKAVEDGFSLAPQCALNSCIDSYDGGTIDGQNIYLWTQNATAAQIVSLRYVISPDYEVTFQGHEYKLYNRALPWREAYKFCEQQGGHLITINSDDEQVFISKLISEKATGSYLWLGATDSYEEGNWKWITGEKITYKNWADSEPNNYNDEDYMSIYKNSGKWNDGMDIYYSDTKAYSFICEFDENVVDCSLEKAFDYNGHRYEVYNNSVDWQTAKRICEQKGGHLVTITSSEENNAVKNNTQDLTNERYWLGLTDISLQSKWKWTTEEPLSYKNWSSGEPNNVAGIENYAEFVSTNGNWNDLRGFACTSLNIGFICEYDDIKDNILGDVDGDSNVEIRDSTWIQRHVTKEEMPFVINKTTADVDGDGIITVMDATAIQYYLANMKTSYKIGEKIE